MKGGIRLMGRTVVLKDIAIPKHLGNLNAIFARLDDVAPIPAP
jgi:hypothetical protein